MSYSDERASINLKSITTILVLGVKGTWTINEQQQTIPFLLRNHLKMNSNKPIKPIYYLDSLTNIAEVCLHYR